MGQTYYMTCTEGMQRQVWLDRWCVECAQLDSPRSRMAAFQWSRRSEMSSLTRASRPMLRIFCVVQMDVRGLLGAHRAPPEQATHHHHYAIILPREARCICR